MAKNLENMSDEELMDEWTAAGKRFEDAKAEVKAYSAEFHNRETKREAERKLAAMTDAEREALGLPPAITAEPEGIESKEAVNNG